MTKKDKKAWYKVKYPCTITCDRYTGSYSGGVWIAWPLEYKDVPKAASSTDILCMDFWENYSGPVGKGETPEKAFADLVQEIKKSC